MAIKSYVMTEYIEKHAEPCWVSMKHVAVHCLEQWEYLKEYFLKFLLQKNFKKEVEKTKKILTNQIFFEQANHRSICIVCCFCGSWLSRVSCSLSINRTYDSPFVPCSAQIDKYASGEILQEHKIVIRWHHWYQCWRWQEHKTLKQNRRGSKG